LSEAKPSAPVRSNRFAAASRDVIFGHPAWRTVLAGPYAYDLSLGSLSRDIGAAIGFVTAVVGLAKLIYEGWDSLVGVLPWLGVAYIVAVFALTTFYFIKPRSGERRWTPLLTEMGFGLGVLGMLYRADGRRWALTVCGIGGLLIGAVTVLGIYWGRMRDRRKAQTECPLCLETVKKKASKCRHCGSALAPTA
jgi:hypothetical protein